MRHASAVPFARQVLLAMGAALLLALGAPARNPLPAQQGGGVLRAQVDRLPRLDGLRLGVALTEQSLAGVQQAQWPRETALGTAASVSWGLHPRLALLTAYTRTFGSSADDPFRASHIDLAARYQFSRGWHTYPYLEAGVSQRTVASPKGAAVEWTYRGWIPLLGAGLRYKATDDLVIAAGLRFARGKLEGVSGTSSGPPPTARELTEGVRWMIGAEWRAKDGPPSTPFVFMRDPIASGLGLIIAGSYADDRADGGTMMGAGKTYGLSWGFGRHVALVARKSTDHVFSRDAEADVRRRELFVRYALRGLVTGTRPYLALGATEVERELRGAGTEAFKGTLPSVAVGILYGIQPDLDFDLGLNRTRGDITSVGGTALRIRPVRLYAGLEWRPPK